jgi:RimJ/RimL family protein N-acetyltransferase
VTAIRPEPTVLEGRYIRLEPLREEDLGELYRAIGRPEVFAGGYGGGPHGLPATESDFREWSATYFLWGHSNVYSVRTPDGAIVGTTTLGEFDLASEHAHIGWTAYDPRVWGGPVNPEAKLLLLGSAFDSGFGRVKIQADVLNERSRAAIAKLGATFEGIARRDKLRADGSWRDTAVFSVIIDDWPEVRAGLEARLAAFDGVTVR